MDYGMPYLLEAESIEECAKLCGGLGLQFVELNNSFPGCQVSGLDIGSMKVLKEKYGIYFTMHLDECLNISDFNTRIRQAHVEGVLEAINFAKEVGIPTLNMHLWRGVYVTLPDRVVYLYEKYEEEYLANIKAYRAACEQAIGESGIKIGVENTDGFAAHERRALELLLESDCFGLTLDIGHSHATEDVDIPFYEKHIENLIHMHAHDGKGKKPHLAFGDGEIDLRQRLLMAEKANARVVLEVKTIEALSKTVAVLGNYVPSNAK